MSGTDIGVEERGVRLELFPLVEIGIYRRSFTCHSNVRAELAETQYNSAGWAADFEKDATKQKVLSGISNNRILKARLLQ